MHVFSLPFMRWKSVIVSLFCFIFIFFFYIYIFVCVYVYIYLCMYACIYTLIVMPKASALPCFSAMSVSSLFGRVMKFAPGLKVWHGIRHCRLALKQITHVLGSQEPWVCVGCLNAISALGSAVFRVLAKCRNQDNK